jgi:hypothetical protein
VQGLEKRKPALPATVFPHRAQLDVEFKPSSFDCLRLMSFSIFLFQLFDLFFLRFSLKLDRQ